MSKVFCALLTGIAVGVLFAPDKGYVTRRKISNLFTDFVDDTEDYAKMAADKVEDEAQDLRDRARNAKREMES